ncbi:MAG TPA: DUF4142 domain-containing protein [Pseudonocardiaceae bacterium]|nr:DUF4142 domain-containing protein [Pseudonocardiaceae bacterium]
MIAALVVAVVQYWQTQQVASGAPESGWTQTQWGPLGPADRDMLVKVRQAGLWEMPTGQQAQQQGSSERVREVGGLISAEHADLDAQVRGVAAQLGVLLPNQPSAQQQGWMAEIAGQSGSDFDRVFVQRLRAAHGKVLPVLAEVRAGTRNEMVRRFATTAATFVTRHHEYLESTGLVDFSALPEPPALAPGSPPAAPGVPRATPVPAAATAPVPAAPTAAAGAGVPAGHEQHVSQVAQASAAGGGGVYIAALVYIALLLAIVGLLCLLGNAGLRARQNRQHPRRAGRGAWQSGAHTAPQPRVGAPEQPSVDATAQAPVHAAAQPTVHVPPQPRVRPSARSRAHPAPQPVGMSAQPMPGQRMSAQPMPGQRPARTSVQPAAHPPSQPAMPAPPPRAAHTSRGTPARPRHAAQRW